MARRRGKLMSMTFGKNKNLALLMGDWLISLACLSWVVYRPLSIGSVLAWIVLASRQHGMLACLHEAVHGHLLPGRFSRNARLADWLCAFPFGIDFDGYRANHLLHHRFLGTPLDPDRILS